MHISRRIFRSMPASWRFTALSLWEMTKATHTVYSQNGEDLILQHLFRSKINGFYVDVGAHHPKRFSNTFALYKKGWIGINIDANPISIKFFNVFRRKDINVCVGVDTMKGHLDFYRFADPAVNTFSKEEADRLKARTWNTFLGTERVLVEPLNDILAKHLPANQHIDLLNVDVEGLDVEILKSLDWQKYVPQVIVVEDHHFTLATPNQSPVYQLLVGQNYRLQALLNFSLVFVRAT